MTLLSYQSHSDIDTNYWRELGIAIDSISDITKPEAMLDKQVEAILNRLNIEQLKEIATLYEVEFKTDTLKDTLLKRFNILDKNIKKEILILQGFLNRKKRAVDEIYSVKIGDNDVSFFNSLARVKQLFAKSPIFLIEIYTYFLWSEKGSGNIYTLNASIPYHKLVKLKTEYKTTFPDRLYKLSNKNNRYKIHSSYSVDKTELILHLYKLVNDVPRPDFDQAIRNKEISSILLRINIEQQLVEIKGANKGDEANIISYLEDTFIIKVSEIESKVFRGYDVNAIRNAFLTGENVNETKVSDLLVTKMAFRDSLIKRSPKVTLELDNESIWTSIIDAKNKGIVSLRSIKDIEHLTGQVQNKKRIIRSVILSNGNLLFTFDDSRMETQIKEDFKNEFFNLFGLPLFQEISNYEFPAGKADKIDYLMGLSSPGNLSTDEKSLYEKLIIDGLINEHLKLILTCKECGDVDELEDINYDNNSFLCGCGSTNCFQRKITNVEVDINRIILFTKKKFAEILESHGYLASKKPSTIHIDESKYKFIIYRNDETNETIQLFITSDHIRPSFIKRLSTMMIPTLIITVGMVDETVQSLRDKGVFPINFGEIYLSDMQRLEGLYADTIETVKLQLKSSIAKAADNAFESLKRTLGNPSNNDTSYTDKVFEDDVFAILKDLIPNGEKWGKEKSGKAYPEGIFAISTKNKRHEDLRRVFSYDCKYTKKDDGYDLKKEEQRKAIDYVEKLNDSDYILNYSDKNELTAHIFISNRFRNVQKEGMKTYFNEKLGDDYNTRPIFLDIESLLYLHELYRQNIEHIYANRNLFYEKLVMLMTRENIDKSEVNKLFSRALDKDLEENQLLDTKKVTNSLEGDI
ncbi:hypothetical protein CR203_22730 [Salipaludibacillus neizhouensis]|uniref:Uncharacterized protein n=1 Tax=Salipaludibacillus neizhouensis TaxID=885475 RepID=A0A3A9KJL5_9BACI|nr:hypothetical protein [Salipaludibacillus neizhouensis]RKL65086.1 hypothetical protein CR203_22730 [Salipaludibacillus neizhouensis]